MIRAACALLLTSSVAAADPLVLTLLREEAEPKLARSEVSCEPPQDHVLVKQLRFAGHDVRVLHECGSSDTNTKLAFRSEDGWRIHPSSIISYRAANMTDAPLHITLLGEHVRFAKLAGDRRVLLHRVDTRHRNIRMDGSIESETRMSHVDVCAYDGDGDPVCSFAIVECPAKGCRPVDVSRGTIILETKDGPREFPVN